ncbi:hypothetical protein Pla8534_21790 [Lignipirellula cremea]|uniref:Uncharacterized protein n=1 Tax=Lignipirellula cremea TaxID=2528010 RepID=A0A518DRC7_9BACT|nr:hypothetical protein Pla8534_21790 [Lignipirellula cremea]
MFRALTKVATVQFMRGLNVYGTICDFYSAKVSQSRSESSPVMMVASFMLCRGRVMTSQIGQSQ